MIKNKKIILFSVLLLVILYIIIASIFDITKSGEYKNTVFIGNFTKVQVKDKNIKIYNENAETPMQNVKVYFKKQFIDGYIFTNKIDFDNTTYSYIVCNEKGNYLSTDSNFIAHTTDLSIKIKNNDKFESKNIDDILEFAKLNNINLSKDTELDYLYITSFDYDEDGKQEYIYSVGLIENEKDYESIIYLKMDNKYIIIDREKSSYTIDYKKLYFLNLIDFNSDNNYEFVIEKMMSEYGPNYYELYNFDGDEFTKIGVEE